MATTVPVSFSIQKPLEFGQQMVLVGDSDHLGGWELERAPIMTWSDGDTWRVTIDLPAGSTVEYKFAIKGPHVPLWETCANRFWSVDVPATIHLACCWDSVEVNAEEGEDAHLDMRPPPAFKPAQQLSRVELSAPAAAGMANRNGVPAVNGAMDAVAGAAAAAEAVVAAAEAAAAAVAKAVHAAEEVVAELSAGSTGRQASANGSMSAYTPEQLEFLQRSGKLPPGAGGSNGRAVSPPRAVPQNATAAAEAVLAATTAAAGAAARVVAVAETVAAELTGASPAAGSRISKAPAIRRPSTSPAPTPATATQQGQLSPDQLEFMRRKLNAIQAQPSAVREADAATHSSSDGAAQAPAAQSAAASSNFAAQLSPEQAEFLKRKGMMPQSSNGAAAAPERSRSRSPSPRPSSRAPSPIRGAAAANSTAQYSPEQLEFLRRSGKL